MENLSTFKTILIRDVSVLTGNLLTTTFTGLSSLRKKEGLKLNVVLPEKLLNYLVFLFIFYVYLKVFAFHF